MDDSSPKIKIAKAGPYIVTGDLPLKQARIEEDAEGNSTGWKTGRAYETAGGTYALCRCGHSKNKPFCDGTHAGIGWEGKETASRVPYAEAARVFEGETVDMLDRQELCAVARFCDVVNAWQMAMQSSEARPEHEEIATREACNCPSGRLTVRKDGAEVEPDLPQEIDLVEDLYYNVKGPLFVKGGVTLESADGSEYEVRNRRTLCRCGASRNLPFCDATHLKCEHMKGVDE
ncbi:MAG: CDGSH iron-sulfur domain-containing protein [Clostridiales Family XIII bacterium]|jgi:CDGSH-type Zn-finger protein|nr:CDGSH iron-sulfur domain-containing protein [Clostridiales Family XIII bacterium]